HALELVLDAEGRYRGAGAAQHAEYPGPMVDADDEVPLRIAREPEGQLEEHVVLGARCRVKVLLLEPGGPGRERGPVAHRDRGLDVVVPGEGDPARDD